MAVTETDALRQQIRQLDADVRYLRAAIGPLASPTQRLMFDRLMAGPSASGQSLVSQPGAASGTIDWDWTASIGSHDHTAAGDGGVLTGDIHDSYQELIEVATPANPAADRGRLFTRANGSNIELVFLSSQGNVCVICSEPDNSVSAELQLNWVE